MQNKIIKFAVDEIEQVALKDVDDDQFAKLRIKAFATGMTSHRYFFTKEALEDAAFTILNKPLLWYYNIWTDDAEGHESEGVFGKQEVPAGFVPKEDANLQIQKDADGRYFLYVDCYVWKLYSGKLMEIFSRTDGKKDVSVELLVIDSIEHKDENYIDVSKFCFTAITVLGEEITPAVAGASANVIKFSERQDEFKKAKQNFEQRLYHSNLVGNKEANQASFFNTAKNNMEVMSVMENENKNAQTPERVENASKVTTVEVKKRIDTTIYDDHGMFVGNEYEKHEKETTTVEEIDESQINTPSTPDVTANEKVSTEEVSTNSGEVSTDNNACVKNEDKTECAVDKTECSTEKTECSNQVTECATEETTCAETKKCANENVECEEEKYKEKCSALEVKCAELESKYGTLLTDFENLKIECESLREFKSNKISEDNKKNIELVLNSVAHILTSEQLDEWREKSLNCENVDEFTNKLKAFAFDIQSKNGYVPKDDLRNTLPKVNNEEEDFWTRMAKKYNN